MIWLIQDDRWFLDQALKACQTAAPAAADALERLSPGAMCGHETDRDGTDTLLCFCSTAGPNGCDVLQLTRIR